MRAALPPAILAFSAAGMWPIVSSIDLARVRPVVAVVRVVARPHDVVDAGRVAQGDAGAVGDERRRVVAVPVERRRVLDREVAPDAVAPVAVVDRLDEVRDPAHAGLDPADLQLGEPLEHPGEDHRRDRAGTSSRTRGSCRRSPWRAPPRCPCRTACCPTSRPPSDRAARWRAADDVDVDRDGHALVDRGGPERVVVGREALAARRPVRDDARPWRRAPSPCAARRPTCRSRSTGSARAR